MPARVTAVGIAKHLSRRHWPGSDDTLLAIHRTFLSRNGGGKAPVDPHGQVAWAVLSTSGLRAIKLPVDVRDVIVLADGDDPGEAAARDCAWRWKREGRRVRIAHPPKGMEIADLPVGGAPSPMRGCAHASPLYAPRTDDLVPEDRGQTPGTTDASIPAPSKSSGENSPVMEHAGLEIMHRRT